MGGFLLPGWVQGMLLSTARSVLRVDNSKAHSSRNWAGAHVLWSPPQFRLLFAKSCGDAPQSRSLWITTYPDYAGLCSGGLCVAESLSQRLFLQWETAPRGGCYRIIPFFSCLLRFRLPRVFQQGCCQVIQKEQSPRWEGEALQGFLQ